MELALKPGCSWLSFTGFISLPFLSCDCALKYFLIRGGLCRRSHGAGFFSWRKPQALKERGKINKAHKLIYGLFQFTRVEAYNKHAVRVQ